MQLLTGTSGFSYKAWKGSFYPAELPQRAWLAHYAGRLPAVEVNNTFYRMPKASVLEGWAEQVPEGFRFAIKASRRITHFKRLKEVGDETGYLLKACSALGSPASGSRLGTLLFQLPPNLKCDLERLDRFLELLPEGTPAAFEFRHESWREEPVVERLRARGFAWVEADSDEAPATEPIFAGPEAYLRLRRASYGPAELAEWVARLRSADVARAFVFFKHEDAGVGPQLAEAMLELAERKPARAARPRRPRKRA